LEFLSGIVNNYTKDNEFIWDEIKIPITYESDWKLASKIMVDLVSKETKTQAEKARKDLKHVQEKYYLSKREVEPAVFTRLTDNWIDLSVRYVTDVRERRIVNAKLSKQILEKFEKSKNITIASATVNIVGFPEVKVKGR